jgi:GNAT superfamily N-acetyltransferase
MQYNLVGGKSKGKTLAEVAKLHGMTAKELTPQFKKGTQHELEHTNNLIVARKIALDHLVEFPDYYDRLDKIEKMKKGAVVETPAKLNDIVLYHEKKGNWLFAKGNFYAWLYDEDGVGKKIESGEYDFIMFPPMGKGSPFSDKYVPPLLMVWNKPYQKKFKGAEHLIGIVQGFYDEDKNEIFIDMMTTNPKYRRQGINAHLIKSVREALGVPKENVTFDKPTKEGTKFMQSGKFEKGGEIDETAQMYIDIISMNPNLEKYQKYKEILKNEYDIDFDAIYKDQEYIETANLQDIKLQNDFLDFDNWIAYAKKISKMRGFVRMDDYMMAFKYDVTDDVWKKMSALLDFRIEKVEYIETTGSGDIARVMGNTIYYTEHADLYYLLHEIGHIYDFQNNVNGIIHNPAYSPTHYGTMNGGETFAENFAIYFINPTALRNWNEKVYDEMEKTINAKYEVELTSLVSEYLSDGIDKMHLGGDMSKHLAPNGKPSNLTHEQWHLVRTPEFKAWFGDWENSPETASKVVDENGEPLVVYHATRAKFNEFSIISKYNDLRNDTNWTIGSHFGNKLQAKSIAEGMDSYKVDEYFLNIRNLERVYDYQTWTKKEWQKNLIQLGYIKEKKTDYTFNEIWDVIQKNKLDGFLYKNRYEGGGDSYVVLNANQIKLADGTNTTFDGNNPDIRFAKGGEIENLIDQGEIELKVYPTTPKHANLYGLKSENPLYIQTIFISENQRLKGIGKKVLKYLNDFAIENGHDVMFGHITQKASFSKDDSIESNLDDVAMIKNWLQSNGYEICEGNNDFYKVVNNPDIRFDKGGLIAPNGKESNLTPEQYKLVRTREFKAWFGDWENDPENASKVVDENGEPLVVHHGTIVETNFDIFDYQKADLGFHFGTKEQAKNRVESKGVLPSRKSIVNSFFLNIRVLFEMSDAGEWQYPQRYIDELISDNIIEEKVAKQKGFLSLYSREDNAIVRDYIKSKYGSSVGFVYNNKYEGKGKSFIALSPNEIKLADGSNMTFDSKNPDIRFAEGGALDFSSSKSLSIKIDNDIYKIQYQKDELGSESNPSEKKVWFAKVISKNGKRVEGRLCYADDYVAVIYGFNLDEIKDGIMHYYQSNDLYLILQDELGNVIETRHIENDYSDISFDKGGEIHRKHLGGDMSKHLAPNGKPSNLTHEQWHLVRTPEFKAWFGDWENDPKNSSKVVDENGEPLVVYHGTTSDLFYVFDLTYFGKTDKGFFGEGFYFTQSKGTAETYASISEWDKINSSFNEKGRVLSCFLKLFTPIIVTTKMDFINASGKREIREGYDGKIIIPNTLHSPNTEFIAFESNQIKLADGTNTTFDGNNPDIRFAKGGENLTNKELMASDLVNEQKQLQRKSKYAILLDATWSNYTNEMREVNRNLEDEVIKKLGYNPLVNYYPFSDKVILMFDDDSNLIGALEFTIKPQYTEVPRYSPDYVKPEPIFENNNNVFFIEYLFSFAKGNGQKIMNKLKQYAHKYNVDIGLYGSIVYREDQEKPMASAKHLRRFYDKQGFVNVKGHYFLYSPNSMAKGGRTIAQTPAPASDRKYGSKVNPKGSASDTQLAKSIKFNNNLEKAIENKVEAYNEKHRKDEVGLSTAKAVVRRGMGAYSKSHRPTISGGAPNSRQAWGLARLNKFLLKKSGEKVKSAYIQDDDLLKYAKGGKLNSGDCYEVAGRMALMDVSKAPNGELFLKPKSSTWGSCGSRLFERY